MLAMRSMVKATAANPTVRTMLNPKDTAKLVCVQHHMRRAIGDHRAVGNQQQPVTAPSQIKIVQRQHHASAARGLGRQQRHHVQPVSRVEIGDRFIKQQPRRPRHNGACQQDPGAFAGGKLGYRTMRQRHGITGAERGGDRGRIGRGRRTKAKLNQRRRRDRPNGIAACWQPGQPLRVW